MSWTQAEIEELKRLNSEGKYFFSEIAETMNRKPGIVRYMARKLGLKSHLRVQGRKGEWNSKHANLREPVFKYFLDHTFDETREHFKLTQSELKSIFTAGYRDPKLQHLRKDSRRKDGWDDSELIFLLRHSGIQSRTWISRKLKRGGVHSVKESLSRLHLPSRYVNGMSRGWAVEVFGEDIVPAGIKTKAGPSTPTKGIDCRYRLIPWITCETLTSKKKVSQEMRLAISTMAQFQRWIHGWKSDKRILKFLEETARLR